MNIEAILLKLFPGEGKAQIVRDHIARACKVFVNSGLADTNFIQRLCSGSEDKFWACISEALLADHLNSKGLNPSPSRGGGPDFLVMDNGRKIWIEVTCPQPSGIPTDWLDFRINEVVELPHVLMLLRWTSAIKEKTEKLIGSLDGTVKGYLEKGMVGPDDAYVIAVNGCQLRRAPFSSLSGISQFPFAVEAVFPVGPYQVTINRYTMEQTDSGYMYRPEIPKPTGATVPTCTFLDPRSRPVSAIWAVDINGQSVIGNSDPMAVIHNPYALNPIPIGFLPAHDEYVATPCGEDNLELNRLDGCLKSESNP
jgi:hypothetical protein